MEVKLNVYTKAFQQLWSIRYLSLSVCPNQVISQQNSGQALFCM